MTTALKFVELAVSKDETRFNLNSVYRDADGYTLATDGHRLHYFNGGEKLAKGFYLNGLDAEFPDWKQVLPKGSPRLSATFRVDKDMIATLKAMMAIAKVADRREPMAHMTFARNKLILGVLGDKRMFASAAVNIPLEDLKADANVPDVGINISYLLDILTSAHKASSIGAVEIQVTSELGPMRFAIPYLNGIAIVMPMRLSK